MAQITFIAKIEGCEYIEDVQKLSKKKNIGTIPSLPTVVQE